MNFDYALIMENPFDKMRSSLNARPDYPVRMENPFDSAIPCFVCGKSISPEADPCPHCGQPEAGVQSALKQTREIAREYQRQQAKERFESDVDRVRLIIKIIFLYIPFFSMMVGMPMALISHWLGVDYNHWSYWFTNILVYLIDSVVSVFFS